jgi:hypothetical protein
MGDVRVALGPVLLLHGDGFTRWLALAASAARVLRAL